MPFARLSNAFADPVDAKKRPRRQQQGSSKRARWDKRDESDSDGDEPDLGGDGAGRGRGRARGDTSAGAAGGRGGRRGAGVSSGPGAAKTGGRHAGTGTRSTAIPRKKATSPHWQLKMLVSTGVGKKRANTVPRGNSGSPELVTLEDMRLVKDEEEFSQLTGIVLPRLARAHEPVF